MLPCHLQAHPYCCKGSTDAARQGHLDCLKHLHKQGSFLRFDDPERAVAGEVWKAQAWHAVLAACDARQPAILRWLLAGGWPSLEAEQFPWHFKDVADPSILTWYTGGQPCRDWQYKAECWQYKAQSSEPGGSGVDVTVPDWDGPGEWAEMAQLGGLRTPKSSALTLCARYGWSRRAGWFPQEFQVVWRVAESRDLVCQRTIVEAGCRSRWVTVLAALTGQGDFLQFAIEQGCPFEGSTLVAAAAGGDVDTFKYAYKVCREKWDRSHVRHRISVLAGAPDIWFFGERFPSDYTNANLDKDDSLRWHEWIVKTALAAAEKDNIEVLKHIVGLHGGTLRRAGWANPATAALSHGRLLCLEYACEAGYKPDPEQVDVALRRGHTRCVQYLISHGLELPPEFDSIAAGLGELGFLEQYAAKNTDWHRYTAAELDAAKAGHLACLQFVLDKASDRFSDELLNAAASGGQVECMRYLHEGGYKARDNVLAGAVQSGSLQCLAYAFGIGCQQDTSLMKDAARRDVAFVRCLHEHGCPWEEGTTEAAARRACLETLRFAHEHGCPWDPKTVEAAIWADSVECLRYIHTHTCPPLPSPCPPAYNLEVLRYAVDEMGEWGEGVLRSTVQHLQTDSQHQFADWRLLMYLGQKKVSLPPPLQQAVDARLARFQAVVSCFHLAKSLAGHGGPHAPMWVAMGMIPRELLECITQLSHLKL
jgi:hypothetical protein